MLIVKVSFIQSFPIHTMNLAFRKYSFKAEHHNMRTYYFATDTKEAMAAWMKAMSLATIMQTENK